MCVATLNFSSSEPRLNIESGFDYKSVTNSLLIKIETPYKSNFKFFLFYFIYSLVQKNLVQATYWHDPLNEKVYKQKSNFLADINNERVVNKAYVDRLQSLEKWVFCFLHHICARSTLLAFKTKSSF